jgi:ABC-type bacteriocin/lantibiotic exporter with double-glycine peptidase domain
VIPLFSDQVAQSSCMIQQASNLCVTSFTAVFFVLLGLRMAPQEMVLSLLLLGLLILPFRFLTKKINAAATGILVDWSSISESLLQGMRNYFLLKVYGLVEDEKKRAVATLQSYRDHSIRYNWIISMSGGLPTLFGIVVIVVTTYVSKTVWHTHPMVLVSFFYIFIRTAQAMSELMVISGSMRVYMPSFLRVFRWNREALEINRPQAPSVTLRLLPVVDRIELQNVTFGYLPGRTLIRDLNLKLEKPFVLVIKGESGVGKSTLLSLFVGLLPPTAGRILLNGHDLVEGLNFQNALAYVGPEPYLIGGTVRQNLLYGHPDVKSVSEDEIWKVLEKFDLAAVVRAMPDVLDEKLSDMAHISTGQKQRLSLARGWLRKPSLFMMDEPTANLDHETEMKIIKELFQGSTKVNYVIVTHKDTFDAYATQMIHLKA